MTFSQVFRAKTEAVVTGSAQGVSVTFVRLCFFVPSLFFAVALKLRNFFYDAHILKTKKVSIPVVSVGNIVAGGSGKTPFTLFLANKLKNEGKIAILVRGYKDETRLASQAGVLVIAGKDRVKSAQEAVQRGAMLILLDDGMQHRRLHRDIEIVLHSEDERKGFLPFGLWRDDPQRLEKADLIVGRDIKIGYKNEELVFLSKIDTPKKVALFCAISRPTNFVKSARKLNLEVVDTLFLGDHASFSARTLSKFALRAQEKGARALVCTEKDFVKLENVSCALPIGWLKRELIITENRETFDALLAKIKGMIP